MIVVERCIKEGGERCAHELLGWYPCCPLHYHHANTVVAHIHTPTLWNERRVSDGDDDGGGDDSGSNDDDDDDDDNDEENVMVLT